MFCISVSFKKTPLSVRQRFACSEEEGRQLLSRLHAEGTITGGVVVSTCNRSEIYVTGEANALEEVENVLALQKGIDKERIKTYCLYYSGKRAVRHLFRVVCGLDSMVLGEDEILHQVKKAYQASSRGGFLDGELNIIFQGAFHCARQSKTATRLSTTPVSVGTLTANVVEIYLAGRAQEKQGMAGQTAEETVSLEDEMFLQGKVPEEKGRVLVIGATGKIGSIVAKDLAAKGISVIGTHRGKHQGEEIFLQNRERITLIGFHERYQYISEVDAIVSATSSPHYTLTKGRYESVMGNTGHLLVDLAVPCDIDREIAGCDGVTLYDIDYFRNISRENSNIKRGEIGKAEELLEECMEEVMKNLYVREFQRHMDGRQTEEWFPKMVYYLKDVLSSDEFLQVLKRIEG